MKTFPTEKIRNVLLFGHQSTGKTSLAEALLFTSGSINRLGKIEDGNTAFDFEPEETSKQISISLAISPLEWRDHKINLFDSPGYADFIGETQSALRVCDFALLLVSAVDGVQVQHEILWHLADKAGLPRAVVVNKLDRDTASFKRTLEEVTAKFGSGLAPVHLPLGEEASFEGVIDILEEKAFRYSDGKSSTEAIPEELSAQVTDLHTKIVEAVAESDDALLERYLEGTELESKEVSTGLAKGVAEGKVFPVVATAATKLIGIDRLLDLIVDAGPSPADRPAAVGTKPGGEEEVQRSASVDEPTSAFVFKTISDPYVGRISLFKVFSGQIRPDATLVNTSEGTDERLHQLFAPKGKDQESLTELFAGDIGGVAKLNSTHSGNTLAESSAPIVFPTLDPPDNEKSLARAIEPKTKGDEDKLMTGLARIQEEDPAVDVERNAETRQTLLWGNGEAHLDVTLDRLKRKFGVEVLEVPLRIPYRETVSKAGSGTGKHVKQSGGHGQYGVCMIEMEPLPHGEGFEFVNKIFGGSIPSQFIPSVQKGVEKTLSEGVLAGYPMVDVRVRLVDGKYHSVDSSDIAFQLAGSVAVKEASMAAGIALLEPIMDLEVLIPENYLGDVMGDLNSRRGKIAGTEAIGRRQLVKAKIPLAEVARYAIDLRSMTGGQGTFSMKQSHYETVPTHLVDRIVADAKGTKAEEA